MSGSITQRELPKSDISGMTKAVYAAIFLIATTHFFERFTLRFLDSLVSTNQIGQWTLLVDYQEVARSLFLLLQLVVLIVYFGIGEVARRFGLFEFRGARLRDVAIGASLGSAVFVLTLPLMLRLDAHKGFVSVLTNRFFTIRSIFLLGLLILILPVVTELVFRGIIFSSFLEGTTPTAAVLASAFLFANTWPTYNPVTALLLGIVTAILSCRSKSLVPGLVANMLVTILFLVALMWRGLT